MCNWFQNKSPIRIFAVDWGVWHVNGAASCYFNGALPTGSPRWGQRLRRQLAYGGLYIVCYSEGRKPHADEKQTISRMLVLMTVSEYSQCMISFYTIPTMALTSDAKYVIYIPWNLFYSIHFPILLFFCGFGWKHCKTATMQSALYHRQL